MPVLKNTQSEIVVRATSNAVFIANTVSAYPIKLGTVSQANSANTITGVGTYFTEDFSPGDVIRYVTGGYDIRIHSVTSDTVMVGVARPTNTVSASLYGKKTPAQPVKGLVLTELYWSGTWTVKRGGNTVASLSGSDHWELGDTDMVLDAYKGASLVFQTPSGQTGTILVRAKKTY